LDDNDPQDIIEDYCRKEPIRSKITYAKERDIPVEISVWEDLDGNEIHVRVHANLDDEATLWYRIRYG
jgi:hypothetical protein